MSRFGDLSLVNRVPSLGSKFVQNLENVPVLEFEREKGLHSSLLYPSNSSVTYACVCLDSCLAQPHPIPLRSLAFLIDTIFIHSTLELK